MLSARHPALTATFVEALDHGGGAAACLQEAAAAGGLLRNAGWEDLRAGVKPEDLAELQPHRVFLTLLFESAQFCPGCLGLPNHA